ncbi:MAG TPA: hypothetical protein VGL68_09060 [Solirubrobacteraceae bacterium]|jgi:hypothetical protein
MTATNSTSTSTVARLREAPDPSRPATVIAALRVKQIGTLAAPLQDSTAVSLMHEGRVVLLGGLDSSDVSTSTVTVLTAGTAVSGGHLFQAQHDAQGANLDGDVYVFGGGQFSSYDHILRYEPGDERVSLVGRLPHPASDLAVTAIGGTAYIVGGYDGKRALDTILSWHPGGSPALVGRLPERLRYAAVAAVDAKVIILGGSTEKGSSRAILSFDPTTGLVKQVGSLPSPLTHASAASLNGAVYLIGGRGSASGSQTTSILAVDPRDGRVRRAGTLARPLSDAAVAVVNGQIVLAGGQSTSGTQSAIIELTPLPG